MMLVSPSALSSSELPLAVGGRRKVSTWPLERPTDRRGSVGCNAVVKTSAWRGRVQRFSNIFGELG
jgi:hypothetical protein